MKNAYTMHQDASLPKGLNCDTFEWKRYKCHKEVDATPMTRGAYNIYRGWKLPADENGADLGYLVRYKDGYLSWSPKKQLDEGYTEIVNESKPAPDVVDFLTNARESLKSINKFNPRREISLALTKVEEAMFWLDI
jgi:hypothetical protein